MDAIEFLKSKNMLNEGDTTYVINAPSGPVDLINLLEEYASKGKPVQAKEQAKTGQRTKAVKK
jgi:hypothetical protein